MFKTKRKSFFNVHLNIQETERINNNVSIEDVLEID